MGVAVIAGVAACSSSPGLAMSPCNPEGGPPCVNGLVCMTFSATAADDLCGSGGAACVLPCTSDSDCAPLGKGVSCSSACGSQVCTPYQ